MITFLYLGFENCANFTNTHQYIQIPPLKPFHYVIDTVCILMQSGLTDRRQLSILQLGPYSHALEEERGAARAGQAYLKKIELVTFCFVAHVFICFE